MAEMITIPKGGRPRKAVPDAVLEQLIIERQVHTVKQLAEMYEVSESTMYRLLRKAREYGKKKS